MSTDDKRVRDYLEQIRARADNWAQGKGYGPGGWPKDAPVHDVIFLLNHIADLEAKVREKSAWEDRYNALLEETELGRSPEIDGGEVSRGASRGTIAVGRDGRAWICGNGFWWESIKNPNVGAPELPRENGPYTIAYIPGEES